MPDKPLISVCIPVYNREKFVRGAILSVLNQTYKNFEIIVIDDGSTDSSFKIIQKFQDPRISIFENGENKGIVYSRNRCLKESSGEFIAMLDSDDTWMPDKLEKQIRFLKSNPDYGICGTWAKRRMPNGNISIWAMPKSDEELRARMLWRCPVIQSSMVIRAIILKKYGILYDPDFENCEDYELIRRLLKHTKIHCLDECLVTYNVHENQITSLEKDVQEEIVNKIIDNYLKDLNIEANSIQKKAFKKVRQYKFALELNELEELKKLFLQLLRYPSKIFVKSLKVILSEKFFLACYFSSQHGFKTAMVFNSVHSDLTYQPTRYEKAKFYIKCLLKK